MSLLNFSNCVQNLQDRTTLAKQDKTLSKSKNFTPKSCLVKLNLLTWPRPCSWMAFWKICSLSPVSISWSMVCSPQSGTTIMNCPFLYSTKLLSALPQQVLYTLLPWLAHRQSNPQVDSEQYSWVPEQKSRCRTPYFEPSFNSNSAR